MLIAGWLPVAGVQEPLDGRITDVGLGDDRFLGAVVVLDARAVSVHVFKREVHTEVANGKRVLRDQGGDRALAQRLYLNRLGIELDQLDLAGFARGLGGIRHANTAVRIQGKDARQVGIPSQEAEVRLAATVALSLSN